MLTLGSPKLNCQYDSSGLMERLLERTKQLLPEKDTVASSEVHEPKDAQQQAYQVGQVPQGFYFEVRNRNIRVYDLAVNRCSISSVSVNIFYLGNRL